MFSEHPQDCYWRTPLLQNLLPLTAHELQRRDHFWRELRAAQFFLYRKRLVIITAKSLWPLLRTRVELFWEKIKPSFFVRSSPHVFSFINRRTLCSDYRSVLALLHVKKSFITLLYFLKFTSHQSLRNMIDSSRLFKISFGICVCYISTFCCFCVSSHKVLEADTLNGEAQSFNFFLPLYLISAQNVAPHLLQ